MRGKAILGAVLMMAVGAAGCLGDDAGTDSPSGNSLLPEGGALPPGCDASRVAIVHTYDGVEIESDMPVGVGCVVATEWTGYEPSIGLTSSGTLFVYPSWEVVDVPLADRATGMGMARTTDAGATWSRELSEVGPANDHPFSADPFMYVDPYTDRVFMEDLIVPPFNCANLSFSDDDGDSWTQTLGGCLIWDHVSYGSGPPATSTLGDYPTVLQRCGITYVATTLASEATGCQKSLDGGMTWEAPGEPAFLGGPDGLPYAPSTCHGAAGHIFVDHRGWVWVPRGWCNDPYVAVSKDEGATWDQLQVAEEPMSGHDGGVAVDPNGVVYYLWLREDRLPYLSISHDDGATWSEPRAIAPPGVAAAGAISMHAGGAGKVAISYGATLADAEGVHIVLTNAYGLDGDAPVFHTVIANGVDAPIASGDCGDGFCSGQQDFLDLTIGPEGRPWNSVMVDGMLGAASMVGAPSLWDETDANGPYA